MRPATTAELELLGSAAFQVFVIVEIEDADGVLRDWSDQAGINWIDGGVIDHDIDRPVAQATISLRRQVGLNTGALSLSPFRTDSDFNDGAVAVDVGRRVVIRIASVTPGAIVTDDDWKPMFSGIIDSIAFAEATMQCEARDDGGVLVDMIFDTKGGLTYSGTPIEDVIQDLIDAGVALTGPDLVSAPTLWVPESPGYDVTSIGWDAGESVMAVLQRLVAQTIAWDLRMRWNPAAGDFQLALIDPDRAKTTPDLVLTVPQILRISDLKIDRTNVRNHIVVYYGGAANPSLWKEATDVSSIARYGHRKLIIREADGSPINSGEEALALANLILSDLKDPKADHSAELLLTWPIDLHDLVRATANNQQYDVDQDYAVVGLRHTFSSTTARTQLTTRGKPASGYRSWIARARYGAPAPVDPAAGNILRSVDVVANGARAFTLTVGGLVTAVHVHYRTVAIDAPGDVFDFSDGIGDSPSLIVQPRDDDGKIRFSIPLPARGQRVTGRMVPYTAALREGESWPFAVDAAPPAVNVLLHPSRVGATGSMSIDVAFGESDGPVTVTVFEDTGASSTPIVTRTLTAPATLDGTSDPALSSLVVPAGRDGMRYRVRVVDVHGIVYWFGPAYLPPPSFQCVASASETPSTGTITLAIKDPGAVLNTSTPIDFQVTALGVTSVVAPSTTPGAGITTGTFTLDVTLLPHPVLVNPRAHLADGSTIALGAFTLDANKVCDVVSLSSATDGLSATVTATFDTDTATGVATARYRTSIDGGSSWSSYSTFNVNASTLVGMTGVITRSESAPTLVEVQGKNSIDGNWGNAAQCQIDRYDRPRITAWYEQLSGTTGRIIYQPQFYDTVEYAIDGGTPSTPPASPVPITLDANPHSYVFTVSSGGENAAATVAVPSLSTVVATGFTFLAVELLDAASDTVRVSWGWNGDPGVVVDVYVADGGGTTFSLLGSNVPVTDGVFDTNALFEDFTDNPSDPTVKITAYLVPKLGGWTGPATAPFFAEINHA